MEQGLAAHGLLAAQGFAVMEQGLAEQGLAFIAQGLAAHGLLALATITSAACTDDREIAATAEKTKIAIKTFNLFHILLCPPFQ